MTNCVFVYGSLLDDAVVAEVIGRTVPTRPAVLEGYERVQIAGFPYPFVRPCPGQRVSGRLLLDLTAEDLRRLDEYEDVDLGLYRRVEVTVRAEGDAPRRAWVYVMPDERRREGPLDG